MADATHTPGPLTALKARQLALEILSSCFSSEQAGAFENAENAGQDWVERDTYIHSATASSFILHIDGHEIKITAAIAKAKGQPQ